MKVTGVIKGKTKPLFSVLRRFDLDAVIGDLTKEIADNCEPGHAFLVETVKASREDTGPFSEILLSETVSILQDMQYRCMVAIK